MSGPRVGTGAAPGKVILFGEHAVVYGQPAVAAALDTGLGATVEPGARGDGPSLIIADWGRAGLEVRLRGAEGPGDAVARAFGIALRHLDLLDADLRVTVEGQLPLGVGLGSSAAFAVCLLRGLADFARRPLPEATLLDGAEAIERVFHGAPSGLDHTVISRGGCLRYCRDEIPRFRPVRLPAPLAVVLAWTPRAGTTRHAVEGLRARADALPEPHAELFSAMGAAADAGVAALEAGDIATLGGLFDLAHGYLNACGVSSLANETMVDTARRCGALGAKLTGAGHGGAIIALAPDEPGPVVAGLRNAGFRALATRIGT